MSQEKCLALLCYWIVKYKPLTQDKKSMQDFFDKYHHTINESFALFLIKKLFYGIHKGKEQKVFDFFNEKSEYIIRYNLAHRDISKEALILYITSIIGELDI